MNNLNKITKFLEKKYPISKAEEWDKAGLHYGSKNQKIQSVLVALDLDENILNIAIDKKVDLIITHHPFLWEETLELDFKINQYKLRIHSRLENSGIAIYCVHTNYDSHDEGTSFQIARKLGFKEVNKLKLLKYPIIVNCDIKFQTLQKLIEEKLKVDSIIKTDFTEGKSIEQFAILGGSCSIEQISELNKNGINTIVTSDLKWSDLIMIKNEGINLIEVSHDIEKVFINDIKNQLEEKFSKLKIY